MEFSEVLRQRRMMRRYRPDAVDPGVVDRIVTAAFHTPSAGHTQGHSLVVVTDPVQRARIADAAGEADYVARNFDPWLSVAPVHIVLVTHPARYEERYAQQDKAVDVTKAWPVPYWWIDAGAALMTILLAAVDEGLAAGFLGAHAVPGLAETVALPEDALPVGIITLGHASSDRRSGSLDRGRRPRDETVHYERWDGGDVR